MEHKVTLTANAARRIKALRPDNGAPVMLKISVEGGGCSGFQYNLGLVTEATPDDIAITYDGATALLDEMSLPLIDGSIIDYVEDLIGAQFKILNPNAASSCGCGMSFSV
jgi:iron-sulfur cluster assembly accessory protein